MGKLLYNCFKKAVNIFCRLPEWIRNVQMIPGFSTRLGWERGWKSCMANSKDWRSENVNMIELNCKVVKKSGNFVPPSDSIFGRSYPRLFNKGGGRGGGFQLWRLNTKILETIRRNLGAADLVNPTCFLFTA